MWRSGSLTGLGEDEDNCMARAWSLQKRASGLGRPPTIASQSPRGVQPSSLSPSSPEALSSGRRSQRQGDQFLWEVPPNTPCLPCLGASFQSPLPPS